MTKRRWYHNFYPLYAENQALKAKLRERETEIASLTESVGFWTRSYEAAHVRVQRLLMDSETLRMMVGDARHDLRQIAASLEATINQLESTTPTSPAAPEPEDTAP